MKKKKKKKNGMAILLKKKILPNLDITLKQQKSFPFTNLARAWQNTESQYLDNTNETHIYYRGGRLNHDSILEA